MIGTKINGHNKPLCMGISQRDLVRLYEYSQSGVRDWYVRCEKQTDTNPLRRKCVQEISPLFTTNKLLDQKICAWGFGCPSITLSFLLPFHLSFDRQLHGNQWSVMCRLHTCRYLRILMRKRFRVKTYWVTWLLPCSLKKRKRDAALYCCTEGVFRTFFRQNDLMSAPVTHYLSERRRLCINRPITNTNTSMNNLFSWKQYIFFSLIYWSKGAARVNQYALMSLWVYLWL